MPPAADYTIDELIAVCIARQVEDGDLLAHGLATPLVAAGYILAQRTHAPNAYFASAIGQGVVCEWAPLGIARAEELWVGKALASASFVVMAADFLHTIAPKEFFRPGPGRSLRKFQQYRHRQRLPSPPAASARHGGYS